MAEEFEMEPLYERDYNLPQDTYVCSATGLVCVKMYHNIFVTIVHL